MDKKFDLKDYSECDELNEMLNPYGVHIEYNLLNEPYIIIDMGTFNAISSIGGRPKKISDELKKKVLHQRSLGNSVRQISSTLGISIGSVSKIINNQ